MIIDCVSFFNEVDLLEKRITYLSDVVDYFVISESNVTFNGVPKPFNFPLNAHKFSKYMDKIIYIPLQPNLDGLVFGGGMPGPGEPMTGNLILENHQRNQLATGLDRFHDEDFVIISDLDEIPSRKAILDALHFIVATDKPVSFAQQLFYYNLNQKTPDLWIGSVMGKKRHLSPNPQFWRDTRWSYQPYVGGWHLSYFSTPEEIKYKIESSIHQELNKDDFKDLDHIEECIKSGKDVFNRPHVSWIKVDKSELDADLIEYFGDYYVDSAPDDWDDIHKKLSTMYDDSLVIIIGPTKWANDVINRHSIQFSRKIVFHYDTDVGNNVLTNWVYPRFVMDYKSAALCTKDGTCGMVIIPEENPELRTVWTKKLNPFGEIVVYK